MTVTFTLTSGSSGTSAGPFNISGTTNANVVSELASGITKAQLTTGHTITGINDAITGGTIASTGTCTNTIPWPPETATPTPTPSPTPVVTSYSYQLGTSVTQSNIGQACAAITGSGGEPQSPLTEVFAATNNAANVEQFFTDAGLTSGYGGEDEYHAYYRTGGFFTYTGQISASGFVTNINVCST